MGGKHICCLSEIQISPLPVFLLAKSGNPILTNMISLNAKLRGDVQSGTIIQYFYHMEIINIDYLNSIENQKVQ